MRKIFNQKGFAITSFLYSIFLLAVVFFTLILLLVVNSYTTFFKFQKSIKNDLDEVSYAENVNTYAAIVFDDNSPIVEKGDNFDLLKGVKVVRYDGVVLDNEITYTSSPTFNNNKLGKYVVTYKATVNGEVIQNSRVVHVIFGPFSTYDNGQRVYFDVVKGTGCTMEEYASSYDGTDYQNSLTGYNGVDKTGNQNSCLLFYAFNDEGGTTVNLLLDHNTTGIDYWTESSTSSNANGPITVLNDLKTATFLWNGTITPENYRVAQTGYGNYTIPYQTEGYKARLITAQEIAKITGADTKEGLLFDENTTSYSKWFYFDSLSSSASSTCTSGDTSGCQYGWLYDRTSTECKDYGCYNNADAGMTGWGYWTGTSALGGSSGAWYVNDDGALSGGHVSVSFNCGARPVITVLKSKLSPGGSPIQPNTSSE